MTEEKTLIQVSMLVYNLLKQEGKMGESFDDVLRRKLGLPEADKA